MPKNDSAGAETVEGLQARLDAATALCPGPMVRESEMELIRVAHDALALLAHEREQSPDALRMAALRKGIIPLTPLTRLRE